jgi:hypothetical protein
MTDTRFKENNMMTTPYKIILHTYVNCSFFQKRCDYKVKTESVEEEDDPRGNLKWIERSLKSMSSQYFGALWFS